MNQSTSPAGDVSPDVAQQPAQLNSDVSPYVIQHHSPAG
ncbi:hypothetical protein TIFTF001_034385 [Ficus carica]|uniref:Uncharacterized protein n=1 Tax=Ficus carica TaxID=3494 RepID=A0AA87YZK3_FICCA|nr:hypothetical protein TIFTF001_039986 [Ficus carica]GMN65328.1 hypothetical protein TIFTF001_034385 [Ficus carica]